MVIFLSVNIYAQAPQSFKYQATARNNSGVLIINQQVGMQISIIQGSANGSSVYIETFTPITNEFGLININIGTGNSNNDFSTINWTAGPYFIKIEMDVTGGTNYQDYGTSQLLSVPYALHANSSETSNYSFSPKSPSGFQNLTPLTHRFNGTEPYIVPNGKLLYILNYVRSGSGMCLKINDITVACSNDSYLYQPIIADENDILTGYNSSFNGYLIDK
jgi:hypothetical protein